MDGVNIRRYRVDDLRSIIGYVPQKNILFSGDIASNLNFGKEDGREKDWARAAGIACAAEFIAKNRAATRPPSPRGLQPVRRPASAHGHRPGPDEAPGDLRL